MDIFKTLKALVALKTVNDPEKGLFPKEQDLTGLKEIMISIGLNVEQFTSDGFITYSGTIGEGKPHVLLIGHIDVVPFDVKSWKTEDPMILSRDKSNPNIAYGRGAHDCKGGVVAMLYTANALVKQGIEKGKVSFVVTSDEEIGGGNGAGAWADELEIRRDLPDYLINSDGGVDMKLVSRRRGVTRVELYAPPSWKECKGRVQEEIFKTIITGEKTLHSAYWRPGSDIHCVLAASKKVQKGNQHIVDITGDFIKANILPEQVTIQTLIPDENGASTRVDLNFATIFKLLSRAARLCFPMDLPSDYGINISPNIIQHNEKGTRIVFDIRSFNSSVDPIEAAFKQCFIEIPEIKIDVGFGGGYSYTPKDSILVKKAIQVAKLVGIDPIDIEQEGATDSRFFSNEQRKIPSIELGPRGGNIHGHNEWVDLNSISKVGRFYEQIIFLLLNSG
ncbi:MAG: M20/M25/M40 family metallo-hydrolase [Candidatus Hodarchaeota archaeon]